MNYRLGSLFSGYGGLDMAVERALGPADLVFVSDIEPGPNAILAHRRPGVPNLGDVTVVDWAEAPDIDVLCGGSPCQDVSMAGLRAGMREGTRSGLWSFQADCVAAKHPALMVWENVAGALSAEAAGRSGPHSLRALGRVLGDLATLGYDAVWRTLEAADVGAPHHRRRLFVVAWPADSTPIRPDGEPWGFWDADADLWTVGTDLFGGPAAFTDPWPAVGVMACGRAFPLSAVRFDRAVAMPLLATPKASDGVKEAFSQRYGHGGRPLAGQIGDLYRTPDAAEALRGGPSDPSAKHAGNHMVTLADQILGPLLATPDASEGSRGHGVGSDRAARDDHARTVSGQTVVDMPADRRMYPTPSAEYDAGDHGSHSAAYRLAHGVRQVNLKDVVEWDEPATLLKTPRATNDDGAMDSPSRLAHAAKGNGTPAEDLGRFLPTPTSRDVRGANQRHDDSCLPVAAGTLPPGTFGRYETAVRRWERVSGRAAPSPTIIPDTMLIAVARLPEGLTDPRLTRRLLASGRHVAFPDGFGVPTPTFARLAGRLARYAPDPALDGRAMLASDARFFGYVPSDRLVCPSLLGVWRDQWTLWRRRQPAARQLSPLFVEWMMGLPAGWTTDPAIWRGDRSARRLQLRALGNGVVPDQAAAAIRWCLTVRDRLAA